MPVLNGTAPTGTRVIAKLRSSGTPGIISYQTTYASSGSWSISLSANVTYGYYVISIDGDKTPQQNYVIVMPSSGGPYTIADLLSAVPSPPITPSSSGGVSIYSGRITDAGILTMSAHASWTILSAPTFQFDASTGQNAVILVTSMTQNSATDYFDLAAVNGSTIVTRKSTGTANPASGNEGDPMFYPNPQTFRTTSGSFTFAITSGHLSSGKATISVITKGSGGAKLFATPDYPYEWTAIVS